MNCGTCGQEWSPLDTRSNYFFSSATYSVGSYTTPALINAHAETILTCPACPGSLPSTGQGHTPSGTPLEHRGDDNRRTAGDETYDRTHPFD